METAILYTFASVLAVSAVSLVGVFSFSMRRGLLARLLPFLVALAAGALFGDALLHLLPEAAGELGVTSAGAWILLGVLVLLSLERFLHWHHHHTCSTNPEKCGHKHGVRPLGWLVLFSDGLHNIIDGMIIAGSFLINPGVGVATTAAVLLHEIPQEVSDFALLLHSGFRRSTALLVNFASALTALLGAALVFLLTAHIDALVPILAAFSAGAFIYIAGSDLVPEMHKTQSGTLAIVQFAGLALGIALMAGLLFFEAGVHNGDADHSPLSAIVTVIDEH